MRLKKCISLLLSIVFCMATLTVTFGAQATSSSMEYGKAVRVTGGINLQTENLSEAELLAIPRVNDGSDVIDITSIVVRAIYTDAQGDGWYSALRVRKYFSKAPAPFYTLSLADKNSLKAHVEEEGGTLQGWNVQFNYTVRCEALNSSRRVIVEKIPTAKRTSTSAGFTGARTMDVAENASARWYGHLEYYKDGKTMTTAFNPNVFFN